MSPVGLSLFVFGIWMVVVDGIGLTIIPNTMLRLFRFPETNEVWIRILGFVIALYGATYIVFGLYPQVLFAWTTVFARFAMPLFLIIISLLRLTKPTAILLGIVDTAGAIWTLLALQGV